MSTNLHIDDIGNLILQDGKLSLFVSSQYVTPPHYGGGRVGALCPYAYCAGDPVNLIDPTGCEFTESSQELVSLFEEEIEKRLNQNNAEIKRREEQVANGKRVKKNQKRIAMLKNRNNEISNAKTEVGYTIIGTIKKSTDQ